MKKILTIGLMAAVVCMAWAPASFAGITGSRHDMAHASNPYTASLGTFADYGACSACHVPHGAKGARLFPNSPEGTAGGFFGPLCMTCHDDTAGVNDANVYVNNTVMNSSHGLDIDELTLASDTDQTVSTSGLPYTTADATGDTTNIECLSCHDVHNTSDDFRPFLQVTLDDLCESCHTNRVNNATATTGTGNAIGAGSSHPAGPVFNDDVSGIASSGSDSPMVDGGTGTVTWGTELTANADSGGDGSTWTDAAWDSGMQLAGQGAAAAAGAGVDCITCHNVHWDEDDVGTEVTTPFLGMVSDNTGGDNNTFCEYCHNGGTQSGGGYWWNPGSTAFSHPNDDVAAGNPLTPKPTMTTAVSTTSAQVGTAASTLVCTSCHGIHPQNAASETKANTPILLDHGQTGDMDICSDCHTFAGLGFNHHPVTANYATLGNSINGMTCGGGDLAPGLGTCHGASGTNGSVAHNRTAALGTPDTGTWGTSYMCVDCHSVNPSTYTTTTPYTAGGLASHFVGDASVQTYANNRTTAAAIGGAIRQPADYGSAWAAGLTSNHQSLTAANATLTCEGCHRLAAGNLQGGDGATMMLLDASGAAAETVAMTTTHNPSASDFTGTPYLCTGCHWVPDGTHPLFDAVGGNYTITGAAEGQTYTAATHLNCESCHSPHDASTTSGSFILDGTTAGTYGAGAGMDFEPTIDYTGFCAVCHLSFQ